MVNLRPGFSEISNGWMLVPEHVGEVIEAIAKWAKENSPLLPDEEATVKMMIECEVEQGIRAGDFEPYIRGGE